MDSVTVTTTLYVNSQRVRYYKYYGPKNNLLFSSKRNGHLKETSETVTYVAQQCTS